MIYEVNLFKDSLSDVGFHARHVFYFRSSDEVCEFIKLMNEKFCVNLRVFDFNNVDDALKELLK